MRSLSRRSFLRATAGAGVLGAGLAVGAGVSAARPAAPGPADWMGELDSATFLSRLAIPGTHDSGALHGGGLVQCQDVGIAPQLDAGIRFLDVRCRAIDGSFAIHHGAFFQEIMFGDVLNDCQAFLAAHPSETVLMRVKQEYSTVPDDEFGTIFADYARRWPDLLHTESRIPRLGEAAGRVVVLADNGGVPGIGWGSDLLDISDDYDIGTIEDLEKRKWPGVAEHLDAARAYPVGDPEKLYLTFTSSSGWALWPRSAHEAIWPKVTGYLDAVDPVASLGLVVLDFTDDTKAEQVYRFNFA
ncbi:phosphatidylinositol-specific phospholipase C [Amycolatopsis antarctica]|nr:phosphatidylinositol-specific phospholipase C [Amycolatopsis antarctica]